MAGREGMIFKFFEKWKQNRLNSFAKKILKDNPGLEKDLQNMNKSIDKALDKIKKGDALY